MFKEYIVNQIIKKIENKRFNKMKTYCKKIEKNNLFKKQNSVKNLKVFLKSSNIDILYVEIFIINNKHLNLFINK